jgi:hypothetical protein
VHFLTLGSGLGAMAVDAALAAFGLLVPRTDGLPVAFAPLRWGGVLDLFAPQVH